MVDTWKKLSNCEGLTPRDKRNQRRWVRWMSLWMLAFVGATAGIKFRFLESGWIVVTVLVTAALGLLTLAAYRKFLLELDELMRKIQLDALAIALGAGLVGSYSYWLLERAELVPRSDIIWLTASMMVIYSVAVLVGRQRYR